MKKWAGCVILSSLLVLLVLRYGMVETSMAKNPLQIFLSHNATVHLRRSAFGDSAAVRNPENVSQVVFADTIVSSLFAPRNFSDEELQSLYTWNHLDHLISRTDGLPNAVEAIKEAAAAWGSLMDSVESEKQILGSEILRKKVKGKQCPYSIRRMNASEEADDGDFKLKIPCGLIQGSSITVIGTPSGLLGNFRIDLKGSTLPGETDPPIILHYNVRLHGDITMEDPVIVQNTWTATNEWGKEERCPSTDPENRRVDDLEKCSGVVDKDGRRVLSPSKASNVSRKSYLEKEDAKSRHYFPFKQGYLAIATLRVGLEGIHMTVDGKHISSFAHRDSLEPWLVNEVSISGDMNLISVLASGLPTSEDLEHVVDLEMLKSFPVSIRKTVDLFIGIFSTANNFKRRMAVRRTWMQYGVVRSGAVAVRFFVGLHKNQLVNEELWNEARTYGDIQLMPFVDYYSLITWKTIAICIYGTNIVSAKYIMKTDDDAFVRVDEVLSSLNKVNVTQGLLYGRINSDSQPHRNVDSKWYISNEEWPDEMYPPWAHGPGYVVSHDIAEEVIKQHKRGHLKMFKLEDVAMGVWIAEMKKKGLDVKYTMEKRIHTDGCEANYVVAHYQEPRQMLCLWEKLEESHKASCCEK